MQYAYLPIRFIGITQGCNGATSHLGIKAIDFGWSSTDSTSVNLYAPFDGKVVYRDAYASGNGVAFESLEKVKWADGTEDYMTIWTGHDNNPPALGKTFKQGEIYSHMGTAGGAPKHCHLEVQKGKFKKWTKIDVTSKDGKTKGYIFPNTVLPYESCFVVDNVKYASNPVYNPYTWKKVSKDDFKSLYETEKEKNKKLQDKLDRIEVIINE